MRGSRPAWWVRSGGGDAFELFVPGFWAEGDESRHGECQRNDSERCGDSYGRCGDRHDDGCEDENTACLRRARGQPTAACAHDCGGAAMLLTDDGWSHGHSDGNRRNAG